MIAGLYSKFMLYFFIKLENYFPEWLTHFVVPSQVYNNRSSFSELSPSLDIVTNVCFHCFNRFVMIS